jgi:hypothetical protein
MVVSPVDQTGLRHAGNVTANESPGQINTVSVAAIACPVVAFNIGISPDG